MPDPDQFTNGVLSRIAVLESAIRTIREDVRELKTDDIKDIKTELRQMRQDFAASRQGMTRGEKIALLAVGVTFVMAVIAAIALVQQAPA